MKGEVVVRQTGTGMHRSHTSNKCSSFWVKGDPLILLTSWETPIIRLLAFLIGMQRMDRCLKEPKQLSSTC